MKKIIILCSFLATAPIMCAEKNWLRKKVDTFAKKLVTRHTYKHNSLEHYRDRALLCMLPAKTSQMILKQQRLNMINFLEKNEKDALEGVRNYLNYDEKQWSQVMATIQKESEFNLNAMRQEENYYNTTHDSTLPKSWITALKHECTRHGFRPKNISFGIIDKPRIIAEAFIFRPTRDSITYKYRLTQVDLNLNLLNKKPQEAHPCIAAHTASHEMLHVIKQDGLKKAIIGNEIIKSNAPKELLNQHLSLISKKIFLEEHPILNPFDIFNKQQIDKDIDSIRKNLIEYSDTFFQAKDAGKTWVAAFEKNADTFVACSDPEIAKCGVSCIDNGIHYPANDNDMRVIYANWQTSQAITNYQQLKNSITQKLNVFPKYFT